MRRYWSAGVVVCAAAITLSGCLSNTHIIPKGELMALAQTPPEQRGQRVRVVQAFAHQAGPPERPTNGTLVVVTPPIRTRSYGPLRRGGKAGNLAKLKADDGRAWFIVAAIAALALATTEGARFDGWVNVSENHPVYLFGPGGYYYRIARLRDVTPELAAWSAKAMIHPRDGAWRELDRAPLNRQGWNYSVFGGAAQIPGVDGAVARGFLGHIQFGYYMTPEFGFAFDIALGWRDTINTRTVFEQRHSLEFQAMPLAAGVLHGGGYASLGFGLQLDDNIAGTGSRSSLVMAAGLMLQLELTTRLALTARAGFANLNDQTVNEMNVGLSIY